MDSQGQSINYVKEIFHWILSIALAVAIALLIRSYIFEPVKVEGHSMDDTLNDGQRLFEYKLGYKISRPVRGDIVVVQIEKGTINTYIPFPDPSEVDYIKRIIGLPGDEVNIKNGHVYINGEKLEEPYAKGITYTNGMQVPQKVPEGKVFVLGDNRERSSDSRVKEVGFIDYSRIRGKAVFRIWPLKDFGKLT